MKLKLVVLAACALAVSGLLAWLGKLNLPTGHDWSLYPGLEAADMAWVSICAGLVMLMTPALGFFYGGLVRRKNLVSTVVQCFTIFAIACGVWTLWGYSLAFAPTHHGLVGGLRYLLLHGIGMAPLEDYSPTLPALSHYFFQMKFAAITPALIIGAIAERIRFGPLLVFIVIWTTGVYAPVAHWVWGAGGWLLRLGALDFAGGTVVHILAGVSALAAALVVGRRTDCPDAEEGPSNVPYVILGAALLWFGWFGFNAGSALAMNGLAVNALVVTNLAAAFATLSWITVDWVARGKPTATGAAIGAVCGLVAITPASGYVDVTAAIIIGLLAGVICNFMVLALSRTRLDDTLDVFACHGIGGIWGALATGLFAQKLVNPAASDGLLYGNPRQLLVQVTAVVVSAAWGFCASYAILKVLDWGMGLRVSPEEEALGLDVSQHGEIAYGEMTWYVPSVIQPTVPDNGGEAIPVGTRNMPPFRYTFETKRAEKPPWRCP
ncbi:MAG: ammonium transporter [candidate division WS1 bacterium]|nr:ammonium transporter [candidate division WS1 bacterium]